MKKLAFMFVAVAAISFASCGNKAQAPVEEEVNEGIEAVEAIANAEDSAAAAALVEGVDSLIKDSVFQVKLDSIIAAKAAPVVEAAEEAAEEKTEE